MGRVLILYDSLTGCTRSMAAFVEEGAEKIPGIEVRVRSTDDGKAEDVLWCDGIAVGTPTNLGGISWKMKKWWDDFAAANWSNCDGKICCTFSSQGGHGGGAEITCQAMGMVLMNFGFLYFGVTDYVSKIHTLHYGAVCAKQPRGQVDKDACVRLGLRLAEWVAVFCDGRKDLHPLLTTKKADKEKAEAEAKAKKEIKEKEAAASPVRIVVTKDVPAENQKKWLEMAKEMELNTWQEPGCIAYEFVQHEAIQTRFVIIEEWADRDKLTAHANSKHFKEFVPRMDSISKTAGFALGQNVLNIASRPREEDRETKDSSRVHVTSTYKVTEPNMLHFPKMAKELSRAAWVTNGCIDFAYFEKDETKTSKEVHQIVCVEEWRCEMDMKKFRCSEPYTRLTPLMAKVSTLMINDTCGRVPCLPARVMSPKIIRKNLSEKRVLVFTKATDYIHTSLPAAASFVASVVQGMGFIPIVSDDGALLEKGSNLEFAAICLINNSGQLFDPSKEVLSSHIDSGRGVFGLHACIASFLDGEDAVGGTVLHPTTPVLSNIFGTHFKNHPPPQKATVRVSEKAAAALKLDLPKEFEHHDEFFNFHNNPVDVEGVEVVAWVDETTYKGGLMGTKHPVVWTRQVGKNKAPVFYSAIGHFSHFYNGLGEQHVARIIKAGLKHVLQQTYEA